MTKNLELIKDLQSLGLKMIAEKRLIGTTLSGLTFVLTGTLPNLTREDAKEKPLVGSPARKEIKLFVIGHRKNEKPAGFGRK